MATDTRLQEIVEPAVEALGFELVDVERFPRGKIFVTIDKEGGITTDDCEAVTNQLVALFAVENVNYERLEVASPGVDRALRRPSDFVKFVGERVHFELVAPLHIEGFPANGRRRMDGKILSVEGDEDNPTIKFQLIEGKALITPSEKARAKSKKPAQEGPVVELSIPFKDIQKANLVPELNFRGTK
ncbi:MAG: ribosome maturation factor RimP [Burkholderiales bacterium]|nr:ribosome maturation factor RimP [Burkholderiales bacterium]